MRFALSLSQLLDYLQLAFLALFLLTILERTLSIRLRSRLNPIRLKIGRNGAQHSIVVLLFLGVNLWAATVVIYVLHIGAGFLPPLLVLPRFTMLSANLAGLVLVALGFAIFFLSLARLGSSWRLGIDQSNPGQLVTTGIYALSRNPIYVFFALYFVGTFLLNGALIFAFLTLLIVLALHLQTLQEERFLLETFGQAYREYCMRTGRYLTWRPAPRHATKALSAGSSALPADPNES